MNTETSTVTTTRAQSCAGILEDEKSTRWLIQCYMRANHVDSMILRNGEHALQAATSGNLAVLLVDLGLPDENGMDVIRAVRKVSRIPIIVISATVDSSIVTEALDAGADDYVRKPFSIIEVGARVRRVLRRVQEPPALEAVSAKAQAQIGRVTYDSALLQLRGPGGTSELTDMEARIVGMLLERRGRVLSRERISQTLWGHAWDPANRAIDVHVSKLRRKMREAGGNFNAIRVRRNVGYYLLAEGLKTTRRESGKEAGLVQRGHAAVSKAH